MVTPCDVGWCERPATAVWVRTAAELKKMRGPKRGGVQAQAQPERKVCAAHLPAWRADRFVPLEA